VKYDEFFRLALLNTLLDATFEFVCRDIDARRNIPKLDLTEKDGIGLGKKERREVLR
jgi:hypothetical protein